MDRKNGGRQTTFPSDSELHILDSPSSIHHSCELEYMLRYKVKAEIEILHEMGAPGLSDTDSPPAGLPLARYLATCINSRVQSSSILAGLRSFELGETMY